MGPEIIHLPNGQLVTVSPIFGGLAFKSNNLETHHSAFPPGWTVVLDTEQIAEGTNDDMDTDEATKKRSHYRYTKPTLQDDHLFISSISSPANSEFHPSASPSRQIAMMLWTTLWWYFHQTEPEQRMTTVHSAKTAESGKPKGSWRINIKRQGIFKGRNLIPKLERMGLIASDETYVGEEPDDRSGEGWENTFCSRRRFWQLDPRIFLFTLSPTGRSPILNGSPYQSRPGSPNRDASPNREISDTMVTGVPAAGLTAPAATFSTSTTGPISYAIMHSPFTSASHLPTFFPPPPSEYTVTNNVRHPLRPKPPRQGEVFYLRYVPSVGQYLSFRVASVAPRPTTLGANPSGSGSSFQTLTPGPTDVELLHDWMNNPRVAHFWGEAGPIQHQEKFLRNSLKSRHSFPAIGCWDGKPFGYFEIYWAKEDTLGKLMSPTPGDWDRSFHCLVGEQEFRGAHRVKIWLSALVHWCWLSDSRTDTVMLEPRVDNEKLINYLQEVGFYKEKEVSFPHKQSALMKIRREAWEAPAL